MPVPLEVPTATLGREQLDGDPRQEGRSAFAIDAGIDEPGAEQAFVVRHHVFLEYAVEPPFVADVEIELADPVRRQAQPQFITESPALLFPQADILIVAAH